jgi:hypothetical protein
MNDQKNRRWESGWKLTNELKRLKSATRPADYNDVAL